MTQFLYILLNLYDNHFVMLDDTCKFLIVNGILNYSCSPAPWDIIKPYQAMELVRNAENARVTETKKDVTTSRVILMLYVFVGVVSKANFAKVH